MAEQFDLIVIGGGSGGLACAQRAALRGARVLLAEPGPLGGTCVNVGCVPKKIMYHAAELGHGLGDAAGYGFDVAVRGHDWAALRQRRDAWVRRLNGIYADNLARRGVQLLRERARLAGPGAVQAGGRRYRAPHIVLATGGRPVVPDLPGAAAGMTSDGFFALERRPESIAIVGGGYIAAELAGVLAALGTRVTVLVRRDRLLRDFDELLAAHLQEHMVADGITVLTGARPIAVVPGPDGCRLALADGRDCGPFAALLWAIGRQPNSDDLGLAEAGVALGSGGEIVTDLRQDTTVPGIHALGDVTGRAQLTPVAIAAGRRLAERLFGGQPDSQLDYQLVPTVVFSHPPIGTVGLGEAAARAEHGAAVQVFTSEFLPLYHALSGRQRRTAMKLVTVGAEQRIVGLHVIGPGADEMLQGFAVALRMGATKRDFDQTIAIHPTSAEEFVTMP